ncbi:MAG: hypothetical protein ACPGED_08865 [Flavobacteriales bacterium]
MQKLWLVGMVFLLGFSQMASTLVFLNFKMNQDFISEFLCINKDQPDSCCEGKCYLKAELKELSGSESNEDQNMRLWQDWRWIFQDDTIDMETPEARSTKQLLHNTPMVIENITSPPCPPPQVIA